MGNFIWRAFIIMAIFIAGLLVGNILAPRQILDEKDITAVEKVQTSLDLDKEDNLATLQQSQDIKELFSVVVRQTYQRAKRDYEYQLENLNKNDQSKKDFIKAQKHYLALVKFIEQNYPVIQENTEQETITQEATAAAELQTQETQTQEVSAPSENDQNTPQEKTTQEKSSKENNLQEKSVQEKAKEQTK